MPGRGGHTAFTAGVLKSLLREEEKKFEITAWSSKVQEGNPNF
ncbi:MAG: hypothetical protein WA130_17960 [Candidatus Methanoperedens sp.]